MQREKVEGVLNWPAPRNVKEVQKFLGLANYYRRFIKNFARIAAPLHMLVRKEQKWKWEKEQEEAFEELKKGFTGTCPRHPGHRQGNESGSRRIRLCNGGSVVDKVRRWKVEASGLHL